MVMKSNELRQPDDIIQNGRQDLTAVHDSPSWQSIGGIINQQHDS